MGAREIEVLAKMAAAFAREGFSGFGPFLHPDFEFHEPPQQPGATVFHGREAALEGWRAWSEAWVEQRSVTEGVAELGDGRILVLTREHLQGRDELATEHRAAHVISFRDGMPVCWEASWDRDRTLRDLGLTEADVLPPDAL